MLTPCDCGDPDCYVNRLYAAENARRVLAGLKLAVAEAILALCRGDVHRACEVLQEAYVTTRQV